MKRSPGKQKLKANKKNIKSNGEKIKKTLRRNKQRKIFLYKHRGKVFIERHRKTRMKECSVLKCAKNPT